MAGHDQLFKELFERFLGDLVRLVAPGLAQHLRLDSARTLPKEQFTDFPRGEQRRLDVVSAMETREGEPELVLVHVEVEARATKAMARRMRAYAHQLELRHGALVLPIVVYLRGGPAGVAKETLTTRLWDEDMEVFHYFAFGLSRSRAEEYLQRPEPLAWALAALMRRGTLTVAEHKAECLRPIARADLDDVRRIVLANCVETYVELDEEGQRQYEALMLEEENREVQAMEMTWAERLEARGVENGIERVRIEGTQQMRTLVLNLMTRRFGPLPRDVERRVRAIDSAERLSRVAERILDVERVEDLGL